MIDHAFGPVEGWPDQDLIGFSSTLDVDITLAGYTSGLFPMPLHESGYQGMCWWSPLRRGIIRAGELAVRRSLRKTAKRYATTIDTAFERVIAACADPRRPGGWIDEQITAVYTTLFEQGQAHSVETWDAAGRLVGGLYGVALGGLFAGESMFHDPRHGRDASKVALVRLMSELVGDGTRSPLLDVQWLTPHLASMGATEISRERYLEMLGDALDAPDLDWPREVDTRRRGYGHWPPEAHDA
ncbi:leucyl/phenylalanyl-tRNA--protein transferase [Propionibacterium cyclohexanicum]|uniref:Leucyl/phenylalanyl-tRNA--protein transferase n=1 Tax=Propionibacterium cyclohexanicum TaxID=64702 RepID=A0A1H9SEX1_9ACTN|nr:leucyl/phenylalanyl-tRNA--protein transferase [Propionibacterium cyclohexanicum]SER83511.1 leucyl/phenylalanyl-tRNA--protein transferase [Propionibacterium cyclohexanicum]